MDKLKLQDNLYCVLSSIKNRIIQRGDLPYVSVKEQLNYIDLLSQFPLGQNLLTTGTIDTFWTDNITSDFPIKKCKNILEDFILNRSPFILAWRELLRTFQKVIQDNLNSDMTLASIPCGSMRELLELDYSGISNFTLLGIDIDNNSLLLAKKLAKAKGLSKHLKIREQDAWQLPYGSEIDLITSCGLNIYVSERKKVLGLYQQFFKALKPNGKLIISFLTFPPDLDKPSEWIIDKIPQQDLLMEKILYKDLIQAKWRNFKTSCEIKSELIEAGFSEINFHYDSMRVFPTIVAVKTNSI